MAVTINKIRITVYAIVLALLTLVCVHVYLAWKQRDLSHIEGRQEILTAGQNVVSAVNVYDVISSSMRQQARVKISEKDLNFYIAETLRAEQAGILGSVASIKGVWVDLEPDSIELIIERRVDISELVEEMKGESEVKLEVPPFDHTVSMRMTIVSVDTEKGHRISTQVESGTFGLSPAPGYYVKLIQKSFDQILEVFSSEIELGYEKMVGIRILDGEIEFNPVRETREVAASEE